MLTIRNSAAMTQALAGPLDSKLKALLRLRCDQLAEYGEELSELACFTIVQPGDTLLQVEREFGFPLATRSIDGLAYDGDGLIPSFEWIKDHGEYFEIVIILSDDGFGHVLFVENSNAIDPSLLILCRRYATKD